MLSRSKDGRIEQGRGNDVFNQATKVDLDMTVALKRARSPGPDLSRTPSSSAKR